MTYKSALDWAENHLPMSNYDNFDDWYNAIENNFVTPALTDSDDFYNDAKDIWEDNNGDIISDDEYYDSPIPNEQELPSRGKGIEVEQGVIITNHGAEPVKVVSADNKPIQQDIKSSDIVITESASTHQPLPQQQPIKKQSFRNRFTSAFKSLGGLFRRKK